MKTQMEIYLAIVLGLLGASIGSFINVVADRVPANRSLLRPPSHCDNCQKRLTGLDLVPVFSYVFLGGRCRYCGAKIPLPVLLVELGCGLWTAFLFLHYGLSLELLSAAVFSYIFVVIGLIDFRTKEVYSVIIFPAIILAALSAAFILPHGIIDALKGAGLGALIILIPWAVTRGRGMGFGDVEIAFLIGLLCGFPDVVVPILIGIIAGGLTAVVLLAAKIKGRKETIAFGPFLSAAAIIGMVWAPEILNWWLGLYGLR